jgi:glycosyltransferase involved in cell wall biosynthesis
MKNTPLVSVGIPTFNRDQTLRKAIESVLKQDYPNLELVISDNASTDSTQNICLEFCQSNEKIQYVRHESNAGAANNFNSALNHSSGEFFMWLGDDDWLDNTYISRCVEVLMSQPDYSLVCGKVKYFNSDVFNCEGNPLNLEQEDGFSRVISFYREVSDNGTFYGVMRRVDILKLPMSTAMGSDWFMIAGIAFTGKIKTISDVFVNREDNWRPDYFKRLASGLGLPKIHSDYPYLSIAISAGSAISSDLTVYESLGFLRRQYLSLRVFIVVCVEKWTLPLLRQRIIEFLSWIAPDYIYTLIRNFYRNTTKKL